MSTTRYPTDVPAASARPGLRERLLEASPARSRSIIFRAT
jgi:hypothetical protein